MLISLEDYTNLSFDSKSNLLNKQKEKKKTGGCYLDEHASVSVCISVFVTLL